MRYLIIFIYISTIYIQADLWENMKSKSSEYYEKAKTYDKEYNVSNQVKAKSSEYVDKAKAYDKEKNISNQVQEKASKGWNSFKSMF